MTQTQAQKYNDRMFAIFDKAKELEKLTARRKCTNCNMNAKFSDEEHDMSNYGSVHFTGVYRCMNCGAEAK